MPLSPSPTPSEFVLSLCSRDFRMMTEQLEAGEPVMTDEVLELYESYEDYVLMKLSDAL